MIKHPVTYRKKVVEKSENKIKIENMIEIFKI